MKLFSRVKSFVRDNKFGIGVCAGVVTTGIVLRVYDARFINHIMLTQEHLERLALNPEVGLSFAGAPTGKIWITSTTK